MKISLDVSMLEAGEWCSWGRRVWSSTGGHCELLRARHAAARRKNCEGG